MFKKFVLFFCIVLPCLCSAKGVTAKVAESFEVGGVRIGMTEAQAKKALMNKYNVPESKIKVETVPFHNDKTSYISLAFDKLSAVVVSFEEDAINPNQLVASHIQYYIPSTTDNSKALYESVIKRYGKESIAFVENYAWCPVVKKGYIESCKEDSNVLTTGRWGSSNITLYNDKYKVAKFKRQQNAQKRTPNF